MLTDLSIWGFLPIPAKTIIPEKTLWTLKMLENDLYPKVQIAEDLQVSRHTLWRALSQGAIK